MSKRDVCDHSLNAGLVREEVAEEQLELISVAQSEARGMKWGEEGGQPPGTRKH